MYPPGNNQESTHKKLWWLAQQTHTHMSVAPRPRPRIAWQQQIRARPKKKFDLPFCSDADKLLNYDIEIAAVGLGGEPHPAIRSVTRQTGINMHKGLLDAK